MGNDDILDGFEKRLARVEDDVRTLRDADNKRSLDINTVTIELRNLTELLKEKKSDRYAGLGVAVASIAVLVTIVSLWITYPALKHSNEIARAYETKLLIMMSENDK
jgi:hypothetical protein